MASDEELKGGSAPAGESSRAEATPPDTETPQAADAPGVSPSEAETPAETHPVEPAHDDAYGPYDDPYSYDNYVPTAPAAVAESAPPAVAGATGGGSSPPEAPPAPEEEDEDEHGMLRMSFLEHLEELRKRLIHALMGVGVAFAVSLVFATQLWTIVQAPAAAALVELGYKPELAQLTPMDGFVTVYVKLPILTAIFLSSPWLLYQVWAFVAPGLYKRERRWAAPFIIVSAGLFIAGGLFAYFIAFRFGLTFLLGIGKDIGILPVVSIVDYFDLFVNVTLGIALVFELPVLIFFLTLLRVASPRFLLKNSRYAILLIVVAAAVITPTPDVVNLMIFSVPMIVLYFAGVFASYLLVRYREGKSPWIPVLSVIAVILLLTAATVIVLVLGYGYKLAPNWPYLMR